MKKILCGAVAAIAFVGAVAPAAAIEPTNQRHYAGTVAGIPYTSTNPSTVPNLQIGPIVIIPSDTALLETGLALGIGTRYTAKATSFGDTEDTKKVVTVEFTLNGTVNKDCSFYAGNNSSARTINFGTIGVRTGDNENVGAAFEMVGAANANVETLTAGCNTNNTVEISKDDVRGLVNGNPGGYDTDQFQANIPYSVTAAWTGVAQNAQAVGSAQSLNVPTTGNAGLLAQGAWRSKMTINFNAPVITSKALVAGDYTGKTTLTLRAI